MSLTYNNIDYILCSQNGIASASNIIYPHESPQMAFDTSIKTKWYSASILPNAHISYKFENNSANCVTLFSVTSANDCPMRDPSKIDVYGSLDDITYTPIYTFEHLLFEKRHETQMFLLPNKVAYRSYRFSCINHGATDGVQVSCINLYTRADTLTSHDVLHSTTSAITNAIVLNNNTILKEAAALYAKNNRIVEQQYATLYAQYEKQQHDIDILTKKLDKILHIFEMLKNV